VRATTLKLDLSVVARTFDSMGVAAVGSDTGDTAAGANLRSGATARTAAAAILAAAAVLAVAAALFFFHLGSYGLWEPDEARYAEIPREMIASGNFIVPHLNYVPYIEKPPLLYWLNALAMAVFGVNEFAARFFNALCALFTTGLVYYFTQRVFDRRRALIAAMVLATSVLYAVMAQVVTTDLLLTATITTALFAGFLQWREGDRWRWLFYAAMGCGILTKGPVGAALPLMVLVIFCWWEGGLPDAITRFKPFSGLIVTSAIAAPWFIAIMLRQPDFFAFYIIGEHFRRFFESSYSHGGPLYYYVPVVIGGLLPWSLMLPLLPWWRLSPHPARRFCLIAAGTIFVLFSLATAKLVPYILPMLPPIAVVIADGVAEAIGLPLNSAQRRVEPRFRLLSIAGLALALGGIGVLIVAAWAPRFHSSNPMLVRPALYAAGVILAGGGVISSAGFFLRRALFGLGAFGLTAAALIIAISYGRIMAEPARSYAALARLIQQRAPRAALVCYPRYIQSLPFYCRRRVILVGARTELDYGAKHSPGASGYFFNDREDLLRLWNQTPDVVLVIDRSVFASIEPILGPFVTIASDTKKLALAHPGGNGATSTASSREAGTGGRTR